MVMMLLSIFVRVGMWGDVSVNVPKSASTVRSHSTVSSLGATQGEAINIPLIFVFGEFLRLTHHSHYGFYCSSSNHY